MHILNIVLFALSIVSVLSKPLRKLSNLEENTDLIIELQQSIVQKDAIIDQNEYKISTFEADIKYYKFKLHASYAIIGFTCTIIIIYHVILIRYCKYK